jgi:hypothetical protein
VIMLVKRAERIECGHGAGWAHGRDPIGPSTAAGRLAEFAWGWWWHWRVLRNSVDANQVPP